ncbi:hypothetical protein D4R52_03380 [bacterium]|nr:MAG: hypothetical protein D4R52_03380 [bacterium]
MVISISYEKIVQILITVANRERNMAATEKLFIIGLTGSLGSGCSTLSKALEAKGFTRISISDQIKTVFRELHKGKTLQDFKEDWRAELQDIGNRGRKGEFVKDKKEGHDYRDYWGNLALKDIQADNIVIDGIRNVGEIELLRNKYPKFRVVAVYADYEVRWSRIKGANLYLTEDVFKRDDTRDSDEDDPCGQSVQRCVYEADYVFKNVDHIQPPRTIGDTLSKRLIQDIGGLKGEKDFRKPLPAEVFMATAVSQSHASQCLKRKVGALIVDDVNKIPLSVGYNDNPIGMESCFSLYNSICYKDMVMETKLETMAPFFCPECGKQYNTIKPPWKCDGKTNEGKLCRCNFKLRFFPSRNIELCTAIHAEERAIRSLAGRSAAGCTLYVNTFPCFQCCRYIKDAGIKKVVYVEAYPIKEAVDFLEKNGIIIEPFEGFKPRVFNQVFKQIE